MNSRSRPWSSNLLLVQCCRRKADSHRIFAAILVLNFSIASLCFSSGVMAWAGPIDDVNLVVPSSMPHPERHLTWGQPEQLLRACVDCGRRTGSFCDWCWAADRLPNEQWVPSQKTPLCTVCDKQWKCCRYCRRTHWCNRLKLFCNLHPLCRYTLFVDIVLVS